MKDMDLAQRLLYARKIHAKLSQKELAQKINTLYEDLGMEESTTQATISRIETGESVSWKHLAAISKVTGVRMEWIAFNIEPIAVDQEWEQFSSELGENLKRKIINLFSKDER